MFAIAVNALYTSLRKRGTTRQLASAIVTCVISALLLLPVLIWFNIRFNVVQAAIPVAEVEVALIYVALCGWLLPLGVTTTYCLFTLPRSSTTSVHIPRQNRTIRANAAAAILHSYVAIYLKGYSVGMARLSRGAFSGSAAGI